MNGDSDFPVYGGQRPTYRPAFEWGLASLMLGGVLTLLFPLSLLVLGHGASLAMSWRIWDADNLQFADIVARVVGYLGVSAALLGVLFALVGGTRGLIRRQPLGACVGGLVMSVMALVLMGMLMAIITVASKEFYKELPLRSPPGSTELR